MKNERSTKMAGKIHKLDSFTIKSLKPGNHSDGGKLYLRVSIKNGTKYMLWNFRYRSLKNKKPRELGIGPYPDVSIQNARKIASKLRDDLQNELDPLEERQKREKELQEENNKAEEIKVSFEEATVKFIEKETPKWTDPRMPSMCFNTLRDHAFPTIGKKYVSDITIDDVFAVLNPIWIEKTNTATKVQNRIKRILDFSASKKWREGENPANWEGPLQHLLVSPGALIKANLKHRYALPAEVLPFVNQSLDLSHGMSAMAVKFVIFTAGRSSEISNANWSEIDLKKKVWIIPYHRMKARREHRVPLSRSAIEILESVQDFSGTNGTIFPNEKGSPLTDVALSKAIKKASNDEKATVHGLRTSFQDWAREARIASWQACEMAIAHNPKATSEAAYFRGDLLEERRELMQAWDDFLTA